VSVSTIEEARWKKGNSPNDHRVRDMLVAAIAQLDSGEIEADHAVLIWGQSKDNQGDDGYMQAGSLEAFGQIGLVYRGLQLISGAV
jgi:hypothetical protein